MYYAVFLFQQAGLSETSSSLLANGLQGVVLNLFTYPNMYYMDKWGRRWPMIIGGIGMGISMLIIGVVMKTGGETRVTKHSILSPRCNTNTSEITRKSHLRPNNPKNQFRLLFTRSFPNRNCLCLCLCGRIRNHLGLCCLGVSARDLLYEYAWSCNVNDNRDKLVCGKRSGFFIHFSRTPS